MFPFPTGIGQVLETYAAIRKGMSMSKAFEAVARGRGVTPSTVRSACTRNLSLTAAEFETLTRPGRETDFRRFLIFRFPLLRLPIDDFLRTLPETAIFEVAETPAKYGDSSIEPPTPRAVADILTSWSTNKQIPDRIRQEMRDLADSLEARR